MRRFSALRSPPPRHRRRSPDSNNATPQGAAPCTERCLSAGRRSKQKSHRSHPWASVPAANESEMVEAAVHHLVAVTVEPGQLRDPERCEGVEVIAPGHVEPHPLGRVLDPADPNAGGEKSRRIIRLPLRRRTGKSHGVRSSSRSTRARRSASASRQVAVSFLARSCPKRSLNSR